MFSLNENFNVEFINEIEGDFHMVLDCEYINNVYIPFDIIYNNVDLRNASYSERINILNSLDYNKFKNIINKKNIKSGNNYQNIQDFITSEGDSIPNDGIIITDGQSTYFENSKVFKIKTKNMDYHVVYQYKNIKKNLAICVKYKNGSNIINHCEANEIDSTFIPFIDINEFNKACQNNNIFMKNNMVKEKENKEVRNILTKGIDNNQNKSITSTVDHCNSNKEEYSDGKDRMNDNHSTKELSIIDIPKNQKINNDSNSNTNKTNNTNNTIHHNDNPSIHNEIKNRYHRLKKLLNNSYGYNTTTKDRFNRLKQMLNNNINNDKLIENSIKNKNNEKRKEEFFESIEEFIKKHEKSKKDKQIKSNTLDEKYDIIYVETEYDLICEFFQQIRKLDPDLIIGYNTFAFDYKYLAQRAGMYLIIDQNNSPFTASRILGRPTKFSNNNVSNETELKIPGRIALDMFKYAKSINLSSASLNYVSEQLLNKHKIDLPYKDMFYLIYENSEASLTKVAIGRQNL
ncbi:hypothetical protein PIROE2DRAFT_14682 [Piromyces sp. E2]|nr:hypothetical protein PIROE2DRAFT_14682 [Piromyces sp. E2]|eukprot:OUM59711.1 hypothetical protein PIROE2DRAFT_14682 [Piromyces sp. E2]